MLMYGFGASDLRRCRCPGAGVCFPAWWRVAASVVRAASHQVRASSPQACTNYSRRGLQLSAGGYGAGPRCNRTFWTSRSSGPPVPAEGPLCRPHARTPTRALANCPGCSPTETVPAMRAHLHARSPTLTPLTSCHLVMTRAIYTVDVRLLEPPLILYILHTT